MKTLLWIFLLPGDLVRRRLGITVEQDGGLIRSFINMCFWGIHTYVVPSSVPNVHSVETRFNGEVTRRAVTRRTSRAKRNYV